MSSYQTSSIRHLDSIDKCISSINNIIDNLHKSDRAVRRLLRKFGPFIYPAEDGILYIVGGNLLSRWLLKRCTRHEILNSPSLLWHDPVIYGPTLKDLTLRQQIASFNERRIVINKSFQYQLEQMRLNMVRLRIEESKELRAILRPNRLPN